jgi:hypothetical protein
VQLGQLGGRRGERGGPVRREAVDLAADGQRRRVAQDHVRVRHPVRRQRQAGAEREVVDDDVVRADGRDRLADRVRPAHRVPEQIRAARPGLVEQGLDQPAPGGGEEAAQGVVLAGRLLLRPDHARVGAAAQRQVGPLEAGRPHDRRGGRAGRDDDPFAGVAPRGGHGGEREQVRGVVRTDHQQRHGLPTSLVTVV